MKSNGRTLVYVAGFAILVVAVLVIGAAVGIGIGMMSTDTDDVVALPSTPPASAAPAASAPISDLVDMETLTDCAACHEGGTGGVSTKDIPPLAHPREGWTDCTGCHAPDKLVATAPGHTGIHKDKCLVCHTKSSPPAPDRPHPAELQLDCLSCHGTTKAHLPKTMAGWKDTTCWLCHRATDNPAPQVPHQLALTVSCRSCHTEGKTGALPANHANREDSTCTACHLADPNAAPIAPHDLASREGQCLFCHDPGSRTPSATLPLPSATAKP